MAERILIVEDEPNIALSLEFLMEQAGYQVATVGDGETALETIQRDPPDLVLLDLMLPGRDGFEVCQAVRRDPALEDVRIVILTARGREAEREKGLGLGAEAYITKPFATRDVLEKVREILAARRA